MSQSLFFFFSLQCGEASRWRGLLSTGPCLFFFVNVLIGVTGLFPTPAMNGTNTLTQVLTDKQEPPLLEQTGKKTEASGWRHGKYKDNYDKDNQNEDDPYKEKHDKDYGEG